MLFIQDGPLAFFGGTAPLRSEMSRYWGDLVSSLNSAGLPAPLLCGIEKSGVFVEHAKAISEFIPRKSLMTLDNQYIRERIQAQDPSSVYGKQEFYGRRFFYRTSSGQMLVVTLPRADGGQPYNPSESLTSVDVSKYPTLRPCLEELDRLQTRMYPDAVIPVALAHDATSIPLRIGGHVLTLLAQEALGLRRAGHPVSGP
jgi:hypothetical protein